MAFSRRSIIVIDDDVDLVVIPDGDEDSELPHEELPTLANSKTANSAITTSSDRKKITTPENTVANLVREENADMGNFPFVSPNWGVSRTTYARNSASKASISSSSTDKTSPLSRVRSSGSSRLFSLSPSPMSPLAISDSEIGSFKSPIELEDNKSEGRASITHQQLHFTYTQEGILDSSCHQNADEGSNYDRLDGTPSRESPSPPQSSLFDKRGRIATENEVLADLDELEDVEDLWDDEEELQILRVEEIPARDGPERVRRKSTKTLRPPRNPPILEPLMRLEGFPHKQFNIRPKKTVELFDGDFLYITDIIHNSSTNEVTLRGIRYQRCNTMNAMLEKKLNELCLFYEIDLDDHRKPNEQSAVEVSVDKVKALRSIRRTNQSFPLCRNFSPDQFHSRAEISSGGGLTARWKYTCKYASAEDRWKNCWKERSLENFREGESTIGCGVSDAGRRFQWRGETIMGGSYQPTAIPDNNILARRAESLISIASADSEADLSCTPVCPNGPSPLATLCRDSRTSSATVILERGGKRERSVELTLQDRQIEPERVSKKVCYDLDCVETTRQRLVDLQTDETGPSSIRVVIDLEQESSGDLARLSPINLDPASPPRDENITSTSIPSSASPRTTSAIRLWTSEITTPPPTGAINTSYQSTNSPVTRAPGQMLTFGDAFCGAGGTTRGAAMAGLRVKWGFDFWEHACTTWSANFGDAVCYNMASEKFVSMAQGSKEEIPVDVKVDILHLSPPCQYFSPAHTVDGVDDEMNTASLYAVLEVVKAAKPRVVTLEQTFGILGAKFRWYFASLIHMFTALQFSVRWAIVTLSRWGLPQRRHRLIIIAACPGEVLPKMPTPTHSESGEDGLKPFPTVNQTISRIPHDAPDHDPDRLVFAEGRAMRPWDGNKILPRAMTTSGGQNYHPSGLRDFTLREYACLQGFPLNHVFLGNGVKKQIGNAVPPCVAAVLFKSIRKDLDEADGVVENNEVILID